MTRTTEVVLLNFCAEQYANFDSRPWLENSQSDSRDIAIAAFLLASTRWYGHRDELLAVAESLYPPGTSAIPGLVAIQHFDCSRFSARLRRKLEIW